MNKSSDRFERSRSGYWHLLFAIILIFGFFSACSVPPLPDKRPTPTIEEGISVYFTGQGHDPDLVIDAVVNAIHAAKYQVDIAMYNINLNQIGQALVKATQRGVLVRLVMESDAMDGSVPRYLLSSGIQVVNDNRESLMHNKFMVIDNKQVWTGSLNLTTNGVTDDRNNFIRFDSPAIAEQYTREFEEMFLANQFSANSKTDVNDKYDFRVASVPIQVYFSPEDNVMEHILEIVDGAQEQIDFLGYSFTNDELAEALIIKARQGVKIQGVFDADMVKSNTGTDYDWLVSAGLPVCLDGEYGLMHHKVIVVDKTIVITGSYNFTASAEKYNDENLVIIHDPSLADLYTQEVNTILINCIP